jgi:hypothetical protein
MDDVTTIHITKALTASMIMELMDKYQNLEEITCSPSVYERTSSTYIDALSELHIKVVKKYKWGAESKTNGAEFEVLELSDEGLSAREIAERLDIPVNRVYYLLKKSKADFDNRKRKHDHAEVRKLRSEGLKPKEISEKLDIPIRTVYYILNKK